MSYGYEMRDALLQLYIWFCNERGYGKDKVTEDLNMMGRCIGRERNEVIKKERMWSDSVINSKSSYSYYCYIFIAGN